MSPFLRKEELFVARSYLKAARRGFLSFLTTFSILGVFIGVAALIIVIGVMTGFQTELRKRIIGMTPHVIVTQFFDEPFEYSDSLRNLLLDIDEVTKVEPYILVKTMINRGIYSDGVVVKGVEYLPDEVKQNIMMGDSIFHEKSIFLGVNLAAMLRTVPGDTIKVYSPYGVRKTPFGMIMKSKDFTVGGIFDAGLYDFNTAFAFVRLDGLQSLLDFGNKISGFEVYIKDPMKAFRVKDKVHERLEYPFTETTWIEMNKSLFSALKLEKLAMYIILILIVIVASFGIIAALMMLVVEKTREIGVLRSMGFRKDQIKRIFVALGLILGGIGTLSGVLFGVVVSVIMDKFRLFRLPPDVYFIDRIPVMVRVQDVCIIVVVTLLIVFLASLIPARRAANLMPVEAIRYE